MWKMTFPNNSCVKFVSNCGCYTHRWIFRRRALWLIALITSATSTNRSQTYRLRKHDHPSSSFSTSSPSSSLWLPGILPAKPRPNWCLSLCQSYSTFYKLEMKLLEQTTCKLISEANSARVFYSVELGIIYPLPFNTYICICTWMYPGDYSLISIWKWACNMNKEEEEGGHRRGGWKERKDCKTKWRDNEKGRSGS